MHWYQENFTVLTSNALEIVQVEPKEILFVIVFCDRMPLLLKIAIKRR